MMSEQKRRQLRQRRQLIQERQEKQEKQQFDIISTTKIRTDITTDILHIQLAYNNTLIICNSSDRPNSTIMHLSNTGHELGKMTIPHLIQLKMFDEHVVIFIKKKSEHIVTLCSWDILQNKYIEIDHQNNIQDPGIQLFLFRDSSLIAIVQKHHYRNIYCLNYYKFPLQQKSEIINQYSFGLQRLQKRQKIVEPNLQPKTIRRFSSQVIPRQPNIKNIVQMNNISMVGFIPPNFNTTDGLICLELYELDQEYKGKLQEYKFSHNLNKHGVNWLKFRIEDIWQVTPKNFYFQFQTYIDEMQYYKKGTFEDFDNELKLEEYSNYYWDNQKSKLIEIKLDIGTVHRLVFIEYLREIKNLKKSVPLIKQRFNFNTLKTKSKYQCSGYTIDIPVYFISWQNFSIKGKIQTSVYPILSCSLFQTHKMIKAKHIFYEERWQIQIMAVPLWMELKIVVVHFLEGILKNASQNLLEQVVNLIEQ